MKKRFYSHIVELDTLVLSLDEVGFEDHEKEHLVKLVDSSIYHAVMDSILSELEDTDKIIFLEYLSRDDHTKMWDHLNKRIENIEEKIKKTADELKEELHKDLADVKQKASE